MRFKTLRELRTTLRFTPHEINSQVKYFADKTNIDFDVYLPTKGMNLQRDFVWNIEQKRELIWSVLMRRNIPRMAILNVLDDNNNSEGVYQIIDGKQRLSSLIDFYNNKYTLLVDGKEYFINELPIDYRNVIGGYMFPYFLANEEVKGTFTDEDKIQWFKFINFAGTEQDKLHFDKLK